jgi:hypothetical protein
MDQYGGLLFQIGGQQLSVAPLGGHSSASRLFLAVTFPREPELHADREAHGRLASPSERLAHSVISLNGPQQEAATVDSLRAPLSLDRASPFRSRESPGSGEDFSPALAATLGVARWERWQTRHLVN